LKKISGQGMARRAGERVQERGGEAGRRGIRTKYNGKCRDRKQKWGDGLAQRLLGESASRATSSPLPFYFAATIRFRAAGAA
jgi:hypothetical protein